MIDSHCHLTLCEEPAAELVLEARRAGIARMLTVGLDEASNANVVELAAREESVYAAVGRHPNSAAGFDDSTAQAIAELATKPEVAAVGETGLDFFRDGAPREDQLRAFEAQVDVAREVGKPVVIHMRESITECFEVLARRADGVTVILHCFSGDAVQAQEAAERGWYCSFAGNVTYPRSHSLREAARVVPDDLLLVETDSPFLTPQSRRGERNRPIGVVETAEQVATERGIDYGELERIVDANAARIFEW